MEEGCGDGGGDGNGGGGGGGGETGVEEKAFILEAPVGPHPEVGEAPEEAPAHQLSFGQGEPIDSIFSPPPCLLSAQALGRCVEHSPRLRTLCFVTLLPFTPHMDQGPSQLREEEDSIQWGWKWCPLVASSSHPRGVERQEAACLGTTIPHLLVSLRTSPEPSLASRPSCLPCGAVSGQQGQRRKPRTRAL